MPDYSLNRWGKPDVQELGRKADELRNRISELESICERMRQEKIDRLLFDGGMSFSKGLTQIDKYITNAGKSFDSATRVRRLEELDSAQSSSRRKKSTRKKRPDKG